MRSCAAIGLRMTTTPKHGARFVFVRCNPSEQSPNVLAYNITIFAASGNVLEVRLTWDGTQAHVSPPVADTWITAELHKLARVLRRTRAAKMVRWRPNAGD